MAARTPHTLAGEFFTDSKVANMSNLPNPIRLGFEFLPPKTPVGCAQLKQVREQLAPLCPAFFSVIYGAGGSTRATTQATVFAMKREGCCVAPHLSFGGDTQEAVKSLIEEDKAKGIEHIVAHEAVSLLAWAALYDNGDDVESLVAFGIEQVSELCTTLLTHGAPGLHFYTMNQAEPTLQICRNLGLSQDDNGCMDEIQHTP